MNKLDVIYIATNGFAVRMILQTNLLGELVERGVKVGLISGDPNDDTVKDYCKKNKIENIEFNIPNDLNLKQYELLRRYLSDNVKKNPALYEKHLRIHESAKNIKSKINALFLSLLNLTYNINPFRNKILEILDKKFLKSIKFDEIILKYNPSMIISTYPVNYIDSVFLYNANKNSNIKTVIHLLSWDNITCKGRFKAIANYYIVWGEIMKQELMKYYKVKENQIFITGVPHFDLHYKTFSSNDYKIILENLNLNPEYPYIFFGMSSPYFAPKEIEIVNKLVNWINEDKWKNLQLIIRPHPQNVKGEISDFKWIEKINSFVNSKIAVDMPLLNESKIPWSMEFEDMVKLSNLISGSAIVINSCSTISIDGLNLNKPVIVTAFDNEENIPWHLSVKRVMEYEHFYKLINSGSVVKVDNYNEFEKSIADFLTNPDKNENERKLFLERECFKIDGQSTERVVSTIDKLLKE